jgi:hypothetical protein
MAVRNVSLEYSVILTQELGRSVMPAACAEPLSRRQTAAIVREDLHRASGPALSASQVPAAPARRPAARRRPVRSRPTACLRRRRAPGPPAPGPSVPGQAAPPGLHALAFVCASAARPLRRRSAAIRSLLVIIQAVRGASMRYDLVMFIP